MADFVRGANYSEILGRSRCASFLALFLLQCAQECKLWKQIYRLSDCVKTQVSLHLSAWEQQLAHFIDKSYMRLEQHDRVNQLKNEQREASHRNLSQISGVGDYRTRWQKDVEWRKKQKEAGPNYLMYFRHRARVRNLRFLPWQATKL